MSGSSGYSEVMKAMLSDRMRAFNTHAMLRETLSAIFNGNQKSGFTLKYDPVDGPSDDDFGNLSGFIQINYKDDEYAILDINSNGTADLRFNESALDGAMEFTEDGLSVDFRGMDPAAAASHIILTIAENECEGFGYLIYQHLAPSI